MLQTVKSPISRHPWDQKKCLLKRGVRLEEVKKLMKCLYVAENMTKCPLTRGVRLWEVSISAGLTVFQNNQHFSKFTSLGFKETCL